MAVYGKLGCLTGDQGIGDVCTQLSCKEGSKPATVLNFPKRYAHTEPPLRSDEDLIVFSSFPLLRRRHINEMALSTAVHTCLLMGLAVIY